MSPARRFWRLSEHNRRSRLLTPFVRADPLPVRPEHLAALAAAAGVPLEAARAEAAENARWPLFKNGEGPADYQVQVRWGGDSPEVADTGGGFPEMAWLSIKRIDRAAVHDWRHLQEIKNMIAGPEHEAVELYPAESRLTDTANQYHLWVLRTPGVRFPFGFDRRLVQDAARVGNAVQRPRPGR